MSTFKEKSQIFAWIGCGCLCYTLAVYFGSAVVIGILKGLFGG